MNIFYNAVERRPRAGWRIAGQVILFLIFAQAFALLLIPVGLLYLLASGQLPNFLSNPGAAAADLQNLIMNSALAMTASGLASLAAVLLSVWIAARWLDRRPFRDFGFRFRPTWWRDFGFGLALGALLMALIFLAERAAGWVTVAGFLHANAGAFGGQILLALVSFICVGIYEELLARGYLLRNLAEGLNLQQIGPRAALWIAYLLSSMVFGLLHVFNANATWISTFNIMLAGLFLGLGFVLTGELAIPIGLHIAWNFFQGNVFGFPVSGMKAGATFIAVQQSGPALWTGAEFGPEAGLIGVLAMLLGALLIWLYVRATRSQAQMQQWLAIYGKNKGLV